MSIASKLILSFNISTMVTHTLDHYKKELLEKNKSTNKQKIYFHQAISFEIISVKKEMHSERAIDIAIGEKEQTLKESLNITTESAFEISKSYSKFKPVKIKGLIQSSSNCKTNKDISIDNHTFFSVFSQIETKEKKDSETHKEAKIDRNLLTEPSIRSNKLFEYLPKITRHSVSPSNKGKMNSTSNMNINQEMLQLNVEYETMKKDLKELNPILKSNAALREQFFVNLSEGKEEKYLFIKNLYNIINDTTLKNKYVFKTSISSNKFKLKNVPTPNKKIKGEKYYGPIIINNFNGIRMLNKSASGSHLKKINYGLNCNEGKK